MPDIRNNPAENAASPSILEIRNLQKAFGENAVLEDISLSVDRGISYFFQLSFYRKWVP
ncbi:MAG: hypothetical protein ABS901_05620 [Candidatus Limivicinus sp.]